MNLELDSEVQRVIVKGCLEAGGEVALAGLVKAVEELPSVRYRAAAALSQNAMLLESRGVVERRVEGRKVYAKLRPEHVEEATKSQSPTMPDNRLLRGGARTPR